MALTEMSLGSSSYVIETEETDPLHPKQRQYSWTPVNLAPEKVRFRLLTAVMPSSIPFLGQVEQYFMNFPAEHVPYCNSPGATYLEQLFHKQYPKSDIGLGYCQYLPLEGRKLFQMLLEERNRNALDIGRAEVVTENDLVSRPRPCHTLIHPSPICPVLCSLSWHNRQIVHSHCGASLSS